MTTLNWHSLHPEFPPSAMPNWPCAKSAAAPMCCSCTACPRTVTRGGGCLVDPAALDGEFHTAYVEPLLRDRRRTQGMINYLRGIQWDVVDAMAANHAGVAAPVLALWGEDDPTFPVALAERMSPQFRDLAGFHRIANAKLLPHEDQPDAVLQYLRPFLQQAFARQARAAA